MKIRLKENLDESGGDYSTIASLVSHFGISHYCILADSFDKIIN
jgi:hypothetical protein